MKDYQKPRIETLDIESVELMTTSDPGDGPGANDAITGWDSYPPNNDEDNDGKEDIIWIR